MVKIIRLSPSDPMPPDEGDHIVIDTQRSNNDARKIVTNIRWRCYTSDCVAEEVGKNPYGEEITFEEALAWMKSFAEGRDIPVIYAIDRTDMR